MDNPDEELSVQELLYAIEQKLKLQVDQPDAQTLPKAQILSDSEVIHTL